MTIPRVFGGEITQIDYCHRSFRVGPIACPVLAQTRITRMERQETHASCSTKG